MLRAFAVLLLMYVASAGAAGRDKSVAPWWWDEAWWNEGRLEQPKSYPVEARWLTYHNGDTEIRAMVARPKGGGKHPGVLFAHGRRGLDEIIQQTAVRLAARGFTYSLKLATTKGRQQKDIACYVTYYPHLQDPNAPEPAQVYQYAAEVDQLTIPVQIFVDEHEQYQRKRGIESAVNSLKLNNKPAWLIEYPGVGRGFDFRGGNVRTFADDLAAKDAVRRAADFINAALR